MCAEHFLSRGLRSFAAFTAEGDIGQDDARLLHRLMEGEPAPAEPIVVAAPGLVVRESTDFMTARHPTLAAGSSPRFDAWASNGPHAKPGVRRGSSENRGGAQGECAMMGSLA